MFLFLIDVLIDPNHFSKQLILGNSDKPDLGTGFFQMFNFHAITQCENVHFVKTCPYFRNGMPKRGLCEGTGLFGDQALLSLVGKIKDFRRDMAIVLVNVQI